MELRSLLIFKDYFSKAKRNVEIKNKLKQNGTVSTHILLL